MLCKPPADLTLSSPHCQVSTVNEQSSCDKMRAIVAMPTLSLHLCITQHALRGGVGVFTCAVTVPEQLRLATFISVSSTAPLPTPPSSPSLVHRDGASSGGAPSRPEPQQARHTRWPSHLHVRSYGKNKIAYVLTPSSTFPTAFASPSELSKPCSS